jgi:hypothetical protein
MVFSVQMLARRGEKQYKVRHAAGKGFISRLYPAFAPEGWYFLSIGRKDVL